MSSPFLLFGCDSGRCFRFIIDEEINDHPSCRRIPPLFPITVSASISTPSEEDDDEPIFAGEAKEGSAAVTDGYSPVSSTVSIGQAGGRSIREHSPVKMIAEESQT
ncbi:hypothetical protein LINPERHAP2_LOCUS43659 [Linum perenne]